MQHGPLKVTGLAGAAGTLCNPSSSSSSSSHPVLLPLLLFLLLGVCLCVHEWLMLARLHGARLFVLSVSSGVSKELQDLI